MGWLVCIAKTICGVHKSNKYEEIHVHFKLFRLLELVLWPSQKVSMGVQNFE